MRIVNHKITISQGETPNYTASIKFPNGTPYMILSDALTYYIEFVVRPSTLGSTTTHLFKNYTAMPVHKFPSYTIVDYQETDWNDVIGPDAGNEDLLHRCLIGNDYQYAYYGDDNAWHIYSFAFTIAFTHAQTKTFEPKTYVYEIDLLGGTVIVPAVESGLCPITVTKKVIVIPPNDFKVEASIGAR